ncbi:MAG: CaiB/BaiF CoA-transferase family protein [Ilumatobacter sp.]|uniref:CaiB/BaiF CoA transferase family protein n=1 Tax=Ilumatobacter sp. TaxID=1967498 RepID=UPI003296E2DB
MGADVIRVDRTSTGHDLGIAVPRQYSVLLRSRRTIRINLKDPRGAGVLLRLVEGADALIEGLRPGVAERLGVGPEECLARNERLVFGRMTGWGQDGPLAHAAGHDINYIALSGALHAIGPPGGAPTVPLNLVGDFGGGGAYLAIGVLAAMLSARTTGRGQVIDAAMTDGSASLMSAIYGMHGSGLINDERGSNIIDGGAFFYGTYQTADGGWVSIGSIERRFYDELITTLELDPSDFPDRDDRTRWPEYRERVSLVFMTKTRDEWTALMEGTDVCFAPVLSLAEAPHHPHNQARGTFVDVDGVVQPAPAPRFSATPTSIPGAPTASGTHTDEIMRSSGYDDGEIAELQQAGIIGGAGRP